MKSNSPLSERYYEEFFTDNPKYWEKRFFYDCERKLRMFGPDRLAFHCEGVGILVTGHHQAVLILRLIHHSVIEIGHFRLTDAAGSCFAIDLPFLCIAVWVIPVDLEASDTWFCGEDVSSHLVEQRLCWWILAKFRVYVVVVDEISDANEFLSAIRTGEQYDGDTESILFWDSADVWWVGLEHEDVTAFGNWADVDLKWRKCRILRKNAMALLTVSKTWSYSSDSADPT